MKTTEEKLISAQAKIRSLTRKVKAAEHYAEVNRQRVAELEMRIQAENAASFMWIGYFVRRYGKKRMVTIPKSELSKCAGDEVIASANGDVIVVRVKERREH